MKSIAVFCGSSSGSKDYYYEQAFNLGKKLAHLEIDMIYGGSNAGLMGAVANGALSEGGKVVGVIPEFLVDKELAHEGLSELILVKSMHERKYKMNELCDGVIALPGGYGTLDELFEMLTWGQLGLHKKPVALYNIHGYYNTLINLVQHMVSSGFLKESNQKMLLINEDLDALLKEMNEYVAPEVEKWLNRSRS
ncbi:MAG TPA: TIGR00730 family Rossman fold protein [Saprospiraceae bacterium]|nr:TIGR00730 family Rossman fold protein [Saprospiraceae bacterium]